MNKQRRWSCRLICAFVVCIWHQQVFQWCSSHNTCLIQNFKTLAGLSVAEQASLSLTWLHVQSQVFSRHGSFEPLQDKTNKMTCAPSEDSDQPRHLPSLLSRCCAPEASLGPKLPISTQWRLIRLDGRPGWSVFAGRTCQFVGLSCGRSFYCCEDTPARYPRQQELPT